MFGDNSDGFRAKNPLIPCLLQTNSSLLSEVVISFTLETRIFGISAHHVVVPITVASTFIRKCTICAQGWMFTGFAVVAVGQDRRGQFGTQLGTQLGIRRFARTRPAFAGGYDGTNSKGVLRLVVLQITSSFAEKGTETKQLSLSEAMAIAKEKHLLNAKMSPEYYAWLFLQRGVCIRSQSLPSTLANFEAFQQNCTSISPQKGHLKRRALFTANLFGRGVW